jgi:hypothetical protein
MIARSSALSVAAALSAALSAQTLTIDDGNTQFATFVPSLTSHLPRQFDLRGDAIAADHGFEHWWYFRVAGDTRESAVRAVGGFTGAVAPFLTHLDRDFADLESRGLLRAMYDADVYDAGPASGVVVSRLTLQNISAGPVTFDLFAYTDLDIAGTFGDDVCTGDGSRHLVTDLTGVQVEVRAIGNDKSDVKTYSLIRNELSDTGGDDLTDALPPFAGDYTGAFQWQARTLQPGEERSFNVVIALDTPATQVPLVEHYGAGSTLGAQIYTDTVPLQDHSALRQIGIHLQGALPFTPVGLLSNTAPIGGLPFSGLTLWVDPTAPAQFPLGLTNASGDTSVIFFVPPSPYVTGYPIYHQYFYLDSSSPSGLAHSTAGLLTRVGRL